jgi:hypothetical protein
MDASIVLQAAGVTIDVPTLGWYCVLAAICAFAVAVCFLAIYYGYSYIADAVEERDEARYKKYRDEANADVQATIRQAKADLLADFGSLVDMDKKMKEQLTLARIEESALAQAK